MKLIEVETKEGESEQYVRNEGMSCYSCKTHLYSALNAVIGHTQENHSIFAQQQQYSATAATSSGAGRTSLAPELLVSKRKCRKKFFPLVHLQYVCVCVCVCECVCVCVCVCSMYVCLCVGMYVCMFTVCVCMYVYVLVISNGVWFVSERASARRALQWDEQGRPLGSHQSGSHRSQGLPCIQVP